MKNSKKWRKSLQKRNKKIFGEMIKIIKMKYKCQLTKKSRNLKEFIKEL